MTETRRNRGMMWVIALLGMSFITSCTPGSGILESEPEVTDIPMIEPGEEMALPLDSYTLTMESYTALQLAAWLLTGDCVERFGGKYTLTESTLLSGLPPLDSKNERRYGLLDPESAAIRGYNAVDSPDSDAPDGESKREGWDPSDAELLIVRGATAGMDIPTDVNGAPLPEGGCLTEANRVLEEGAPPEPANTRLGTDLGVEAHERSEKDSRVVEAAERWSECMQRAGHSYDEVSAPNNQDWPEPPTDAEIAVAMADVNCKLETNLVGISFAVESAYQEQLIEENARALEEIRMYLEVQLENAARVLAQN